MRIVKKIDGLKMTWDELTAYIMEMNAGPDQDDEELKLTGFHFENIVMEYDGYGTFAEGEGRYTWSASFNYGVAGHVGNLYPMKNAEYVKFFKTLNGARKNLLKNISWMKDQFAQVDEEAKEREASIKAYRGLSGMVEAVFGTMGVSSNATEIADFVWEHKEELVELLQGVK